MYFPASPVHFVECPNIRNTKHGFDSTNIWRRMVRRIEYSTPNIRIFGFDRIKMPFTGMFYETMSMPPMKKDVKQSTTSLISITLSKGICESRLAKRAMHILNLGSYLGRKFRTKRRLMFWLQNWQGMFASIGNN